MKLKKALKTVDNFKGKVFYGTHMYPGISEFVIDAEGNTQKLFISDQTIRSMGPSLEGCPVFCVHKTPVGTVDDVRNDSHGTVVESFFNPADGLHWIKFVVTSSKAERLIAQGYGLSNGYNITSEGPGGNRNGVDYDLEVLDGEFHHVAIVKDPRYESVILTPEEFKAYNDEKHDELRRVANSKNTKKGSSMKTKPGSISFFSRKKVDNSKELEATSVMLPKSKVEKSIAEIVDIADRAVVNAKKPRVCNEDDIVQVEEDGEDKEITIGALVKEIVALREEVAELKALEEEEAEEIENEDDVDDSEDDDEVENEEEEDSDEVENEDDEEEKPKKKKAENSRFVMKPAAGKAAKKPTSKSSRVDNEDVEGRRRAKSIRNAHTRGVQAREEPRRIETSATKIQRGMDRYG